MDRTPIAICVFLLSIFLIGESQNMDSNRGLIDLRLRFDNREPISSKPSDPIEVEAGTYNVMCIAESRGEPSKEVNLKIDGKETNLHKQQRVDKGESDPTVSITTIERNVSFDANKGKVSELECFVKDESGKTISTKLDVTVLPSRDATIDCKRVTTDHEGDNVIIECTIDHTELDVSGYALQYGRTGKLVERQELGGKLVVNDISETESIITLTLEKLESDLYIVIITKDGGRVKEILNFNNDNVNGTSSESPTGSVGCTVAMAVIALWNIL